MQAVTRTLARYACASTWERLPGDVRRSAVRAFVNWIGCAAGGCREGDVQLMAEFLREFNGTPEAILIGRAEKLDALNAAFINSMSSAALAFNDTHTATVAHPTSPVAAALLALAQRRPLTGTELLHALALGIEVQCRVGNILCAPPAECPVGLSTQGLLGGIGAAVAAAKALGQDEKRMAIAIGLAANQASGLRESQSTMGSHFIPGHAARCGLAAALLAGRGFDCSDTMIEGPKGFAVSYGIRPRMEAAIEGLGERFEIETLAFKPYPAGVVIHPIIDACLEIAGAGAIEAERIERIEITVNPLAVKLTNIVDPRDRGQALVSFQHWAAVTLMQGAAGIAQVAEEVVRDPAVSRLRQRVAFTELDSMGREAASVNVVLRDGSARRAHVTHCRGSRQRPMSDEDIAEKTRAQLRVAYPPGMAERILSASWAIGECARVDAFCASLAATG